MDEEFELQTHQAEEWHWWYRGRREVIRATIRSLQLPAGAEILDAGCGSGRNMVELAAFGKVTGLELAPVSIERARRRGVGEVVEGSLSEPLPFPDDSFDLAVSFDVIEHLDDDAFALGELRRVVRPTGQLVVTVPAYPWLWSSHDEVNHHRRRYTEATLLAAAAPAGWTPVRTTHFNSLLLPAAVVYRALDRLLRRSPPAAADLDRTPGWLNTILERPMRLEARLISRGHRIPAGLSLLAVFS
jgi:SAM-dependent methyltransferase